MESDFDRFRKKLIRLSETLTHGQVDIVDCIVDFDLCISNLEERISEIVSDLDDLSYKLHYIESLLDIDANGEIDNLFQVIYVMIDEIKSSIKTSII